MKIASLSHLCEPSVCLICNRVTMTVGKKTNKSERLKDGEAGAVIISLSTKAGVVPRHEACTALFQQRLIQWKQK